MQIPLVTLKHTDLEVSRFCFGTMTFGKPLDQAGATQLVNRCIEAGINFFDTANVYQKGIAETMLGHAIKGKRDRLIIASKVHGKMGDGADQQGLSRKAILRAIDESLQRLGTDYLDLYYFHMPDYSTPVEESMEAMESLRLTCSWRAHLLAAALLLSVVSVAGCTGSSGTTAHGAATASGAASPAGGGFGLPAPPGLLLRAARVLGRGWHPAPAQQGDRRPRRDGDGPRAWPVLRRPGNPAARRKPVPWTGAPG